MSGRVATAMYIRLPMSSLYGIATLHLRIFGDSGAELSGQQSWRPAIIGVSAVQASPTSKWDKRWLMYAIWDSEMVWDGWLYTMAIPNANFSGPRSEISHLV